MRDSIEKTLLVQRRDAATGLLTGIALVAAVVLSRRVSGDARPLESQTWAVLVGSVGILTASVCSRTPGLLSSLSGAQRRLLIGLLGLPGLILGLALLPVGSAGGFVVLLSVFGISVGVGHLADDQRFVAGTPSADSLIDISLDQLPAESRSFEPPPPTDACPESTPIDHVPTPDLSSTFEPTPSDEGLVCDEFEARLLAKLTDADRELVAFEDSQAEQTQDHLLAPAAQWPTELMGDPSTSQWMARSRQADQEVVRGQLTLVFERHQQIVSGYVSFFPPLESTPDVETDRLDEDGVVLTLGQQFPYGIRFDLKRPKHQASQSRTVKIGYVACSSVALPDPQRVSA